MLHSSSLLEEVSGSLGVPACWKMIADKLMKEYVICLLYLEAWRQLVQQFLFRGNLKRSRNEFEDSQRKIENELWVRERDRMTMQIENLKAKISNMEILEQSYLEERDKLSTLFDKGIIDESGCFICKKREKRNKGITKLFAAFIKSFNKFC